MVPHGISPAKRCWWLTDILADTPQKAPCSSFPCGKKSCTYYKLFGMAAGGFFDVQTGSTFTSLSISIISQIVSLTFTTIIFSPNTSAVICVQVSRSMVWFFARNLMTTWPVSRHRNDGGKGIFLSTYSIASSPAISCLRLQTGLRYFSRSNFSREHSLGS